MRNEKQAEGRPWKAGMDIISQHENRNIIAFVSSGSQIFYSAVFTVLHCTAL